MKRAPAPTRADLLTELARAYLLEPVAPDEITIPMLVEQGICNNHMQAARLMRKAQKDGKLAPPVERASANGNRVKAWRRLK